MTKSFAGSPTFRNLKSAIEFHDFYECFYLFILKWFTRVSLQLSENCLKATLSLQLRCLLKERLHYKFQPNWSAEELRPPRRTAPLWWDLPQGKSPQTLRHGGGGGGSSSSDLSFRRSGLQLHHRKLVGVRWSLQIKTVSKCRSCRSDLSSGGPLQKNVSPAVRASVLLLWISGRVESLLTWKGEGQRVVVWP